MPSSPLPPRSPPADAAARAASNANADTARRDPWAPLRLRDFRMFLAALLAATVGIQVQGTVVAYQIYTLTRDPLALGFVGLAEALPFISLALAGGHVADTKNRKSIVLLALVTQLGCVLGLLAATRLIGHASALTLRFVIYGLIAGGGVARAFMQPARNAFAADIVPVALQADSVTVRTGAWQMAAVVGPGLGGILYAWLGASGAYIVAAVLVGTAVGIVGLVNAPAPGPTRGRPTSLLGGLRESLRFLRGEQVLLGAITLDLFAVLFGGATALLPLFAEEILHVGPTQFGVLRAAPAVGAVIMSLALALTGLSRRVGRQLLIAVTIFGLCMIGFGLSRSYPLSVALLAISGAADMVSVIVRGTLLQVRVPREMLGRLASINQIFVGSSNEIGEFESGVAARLLGAVPSVVAGGILTLLVVGITARQAPKLRTLGPLR